MSEESINGQSVGRFQQLMLITIGSIVAAYLASSQMLFQIQIPNAVAVVFVAALIGYFLNRMLLKFEKYVDNQMLIQRMRAEQEKQIVLAESCLGVDKELLDALHQRVLHEIQKDFNVHPEVPKVG